MPVTQRDSWQALETALAALFPPGTATALVRIDAPHPAPFPEERPAIAGAVAARCAEFTAGRTAARQALAALGLAPAAIPTGPQRQPLWPPGISGSIAHAAGLAGAALRHGAPLGLDIEEDAPLAPDLWPLICEADELAALPTEGRGTYVRQVFSAKEAAFKAQFPRTGALIGFDAMQVRLSPGTFTARFRETVGDFPVGHVFQGRLICQAGIIFAGVSL